MVPQRFEERQSLSHQRVASCQVAAIKIEGDSCSVCLRFLPFSGRDAERDQGNQRRLGVLPLPLIQLRRSHYEPEMDFIVIGIFSSMFCKFRRLEITRFPQKALRTFVLKLKLS